MPFRHDIAGGQGNLIATSVQSPNFAAGSAGWQIRKDGSAEFNNVVIRGGTVVSGLALYYDPAPGPGNLVASVAATAGTDPYGNAYTAGVSSYGGGGGVTSLLQGRVVFDAADDTYMTLIAGNLRIAGLNCSLQVQIPVQTLTALQPGTGSTPESWHPITLDAGWTSVVAPEYRLLPDGNVQARGQLTHAGVTTATNINNGNPIPAAYWPAANRVYRPPVAGDSAGTVQISSTGVFAMRASGFTATQAILDGIYSI
jgi:hypothetical protein